MVALLFTSSLKQAQELLFTSKPQDMFPQVEVRYSQLQRFFLKGSVAELVEHWPATRCVVGSIPAGGALEVGPWTSVLNSLVG